MSILGKRKEYFVVRETKRAGEWSDEGCYDSIIEARKMARLEKKNYPSHKVQIWKESTTITVEESL